MPSIFHIIGLLRAENYTIEYDKTNSASYTNEDECVGCWYRDSEIHTPDEGWCYMFKERMPDCQARKETDSNCSGCIFKSKNTDSNKWCTVFKIKQKACPFIKMEEKIDGNI